MEALLSVSVLLRPLVDGPTRTLLCVDRAPSAWQLTDDSGRVVCAIATPDAIMLPHALTVDTLPRPRTELRIGAGGLHVANRSYRPHRWVTPPRPRLTDIRVAGSVAQQFAAHWSDRLGLGPGLTPYHDDVLCGVLVVLAATGVAPDLRASVAASDLEQRTTAPSAALIRLACDGWCITPVADHLQRLAAGVDDPQTRDRLLAVGHTSGHGLLAGMTTVLAVRPAEVAA
jgi:hypothetical protein